MEQKCKNKFLVELLELQQDGRRAISAPANWGASPLLNVGTNVDLRVQMLANEMLIGKGNPTARWHFFIGSPGNGKSAAMGKLYTQLKHRGCKILAKGRKSIDELPADSLPYSLDVYEEGNNFASARIVQDASAVESPFADNVDPASDLAETVKQAWERGISLVVCTNRGVLEKVYSDYHKDAQSNSAQWFKIIRRLTEQKNFDAPRKFDSEGNKRRAFEQVKIDYMTLDNRSLLSGKERNVLNNLIEQAIKPKRWKSCSQCAARNLCPFRNNMAWLENKNGRDNVLSLLRRAEVFSGQVLVFREAIALISFLLAGCPEDYGENHPCEWVHEKIRQDDIFSLASRRIYMCLYASFLHYGLEFEKNWRDVQIQAFKKLIGETVRPDDKSRNELKPLRFVVEKDTAAPSINVGVTRFLGQSGIISKLDPCRDALEAGFYEKWDMNAQDMKSFQESSLYTEIEKRCIHVWKVMEEADCFHDTNLHWAIRRWSSNFLLHFGALQEGLTAWSAELDKFSGLWEILNVEEDERSMEDQYKVVKLKSQLADLIVNISGKQDMSVMLKDNVILGGKWVTENLRPDIVPREESGSMSLSVAFGSSNSKKAEMTSFSAQLYVWLEKSKAWNLDLRCFPEDLLFGIKDVRNRSASKGDYAFVSEDVLLSINAGENTAYKIKRLSSKWVIVEKVNE